MQTVAEYLDHLQGKGFQFQEDAVGFIYFGKHYTNATDTITNAAIEITLKAQRRFDGSFYVSLLETLVSHGIDNRIDALKFVKEKDLLAI